MKIFGAVLVIAGIVWGVVALNMDTSIDGRIHNVSLADRRQTHLIASGVLAIVGAILFGFGSVRSSATLVGGDARKCPFCAELVKSEAILCKHCGKDLPIVEGIDVCGLKLPPNVSLDDYQEQLCYRHSVKREGGKFFWKGKSYDVLGDLVAAIDASGSKG